MLSPSSARKAEKLGYKNVKVFHGGLPNWKKANNLVVSSPDYLKQAMDQNMPVVVIDLRDKATAQKSHIKGAVSIPVSELATYQSKFPKEKAAPVILYADNKNTAVEAFSIVRGWGYKNAAILQGNYEGWVEAKGPVDQSSLASEIVYVPKPVPGQIAIEKFKALASNTPADVFILDARDVDEVQAGMIKGAVNIPTQEVINRLSKIPKNKVIVVHCKTGLRAEMAYQTLKENGYTAEFLKAKIDIAKDGSFKISES